MILVNPAEIYTALAQTPNEHAAADLVRVIETCDRYNVVRCKDCQWFAPGLSRNMCRHRNGMVSPGENDFCSNGREE